MKILDDIALVGRQLIYQEMCHSGSNDEVLCAHARSISTSLMLHRIELLTESTAGTSQTYTRGAKVWKSAKLGLK